MTALVIGIGNPDRGDDAVGPAVVERLAQSAPSIHAATCAGDLTRLLDLWHAHQQVILVDMLVIPGTPAGTVRTFDLRREPQPYALTCSSHALDLSQCVELARVLGALPAKVELLGVVGAQTTPGAPLTPAVHQAVSAVCAELTRRLGTSGADEDGEAASCA